MPAQSETRENSLQRLRGRVARSRSIGTKLTPDEEQADPGGGRGTRRGAKRMGT